MNDDYLFLLRLPFVSPGLRRYRPALLDKILVVEATPSFYFLDGPDCFNIAKLRDQSCIKACFKLERALGRWRNDIHWDASTQVLYPEYAMHYYRDCLAYRHLRHPGPCDDHAAAQEQKFDRTQLVLLHLSSYFVAMII